ncbi:MAG: hypothetical protein V3T54_01310, partial [Acidobacteriota bacterium]
SLARKGGVKFAGAMPSRKVTAADIRQREERKAESVALAKAIMTAGENLRVHAMETEAANKALDALTILGVELVGHDAFKRFGEIHALKAKKHQYGGKDWEGTVRARIQLRQATEKWEYDTASVVELMLLDPRFEGWTRKARSQVLKLLGVDMAALKKQELQRIRAARKARTNKPKSKPKSRKVRSSRKK